MAKLMNGLLLKRLNLLQAFVLLCVLTLLAVLAVIIAEFAWAEYWRQRFGETEWILPALAAAVLLTVAAAIVALAVLFYRWKLKRPLEILKQASEKISANDLDFRLSYDSRDELGGLVAAFEQMRSQLELNLKTLWRSVEERKQLNAIFAHDLRTPLSVMKGCTEFLATYLPGKKLSEETVLSHIHTINLHIVRLESYVEAMSSMQRLEDAPLRRRRAEPTVVAALLNDSGEQIARRFGKRFVSSLEGAGAELDLDTHMVMQVFENLVANGARYAASQVNARYAISGDALVVTVTDDGPGFSDEALDKAALPFYRGEEREWAGHRGLGLYICKVLCERHGGTVRIENKPDGGGRVTASFEAQLINR